MHYRFLIVSPYTLPEEAGSGIHAFRFARFLNHHGTPAKILSFNRNLNFKTRETNDAVDIFRIPYFNRNIIFKILSLPLVYIGFLIQTRSAQVVIIYGSQIAGIGFLILTARLFKKIIIFRSTLLGVDDFETIGTHRNVFKKFNYHLLLKCNFYFSINKEFSRRFHLINRKKPELFECPQGVDTMLFRPVTHVEKNFVRGKMGLPTEKFIILSAGFLLKRKGFDELFKALSSFDEDFLLLVIGQFEPGKGHFLKKRKNEMWELKTKGEKLLGDKIQFVGFSLSVHEYLQASDLFILNSQTEGTPNAMLEAMSTGIPVITRQMEGLQNFVCFNNSNCLEYTSKEAIVECISQVKNNRHLSEKLGSEARQRILESFSFEVVTEKLITRINSLKNLS